LADDEPAEQATVEVETAEDGSRRWVEQRTRPKPDGRSDSLQIRYSRAARDGETPEQAAADFLAFAKDRPRVPVTHMAIVGPPPLGGFSAYSGTYPDGSSFYSSYARPDLVDGSRPTPLRPDAAGRYGLPPDQLLQEQHRGTASGRVAPGGAELTFLNRVLALGPDPSPADVFGESLLIDYHGQLREYYAPLDHLNARAGLCVVEGVPTEQQVTRACAAARKVLRADGA